MKNKNKKAKKIIKNITKDTFLYRINKEITMKKSYKSYFKIIILTIFLISITISLTSCNNNEDKDIGTITGNMIVEKYCQSNHCPKLTDKELETIFSKRKIVIYDTENMNKIKETFLDENGTYNIKLKEGDYYMEVSNNNFDTIVDFPKYITIEKEKTTILNIEIQINN